MNTKKRIIEAALTLFAQKGYTDVYVGDIAEAVGIKAPSLYKHFKSKKDIFEALIEEMSENYLKQTAAIGINCFYIFYMMNICQNFAKSLHWNSLRTLNLQVFIQSIFLKIL